MDCMTFILTFSSLPENLVSGISGAINTFYTDINYTICKPWCVDVRITVKEIGE